MARGRRGVAPCRPARCSIGAAHGHAGRPPGRRSREPRRRVRAHEAQRRCRGRRGAGGASRCEAPQGQGARPRRRGARRRASRRPGRPAHLHERLGRVGASARAALRRDARAGGRRARRARPPGGDAEGEVGWRARRAQRAPLDHVTPPLRRVPARADRCREAVVEGAGRRPRALALPEARARRGRRHDPGGGRRRRDDRGRRHRRRHEPLQRSRHPASS